MDNSHEALSHGSRLFPIGLHKTIVPPNHSLGKDAKYAFLYSHWHPEFELLYLSRGEIVYVIGGEEYPLSAGDVIFVPANTLHWAYRTSNGSETVFYAAVFSRQLLSEPADIISEKYISPAISGERRINTVFKRSVPWQAEVIDLLIEIMSLYDYSSYDNDPLSGKYPELFIRQDEYGAEITVKANILRIWKILICHSEKAEQPKAIGRTNLERVRVAIDFIHQHYSEQLSLERIASEIYMSREYFSRVFKEQTHQTPFEYLTQYRISRAMELLEHSDMSITDIAGKCGFAQTGYFSVKFSEIAGCTPTAYRKGAKHIKNSSK